MASSMTATSSVANDTYHFYVESLCKSFSEPSDVLARARQCDICFFGFTDKTSPGYTTPLIESEFAAKKLACSDTVPADRLRERLKSERVGAVSVKARKPMMPNQDNMFFLRAAGITVFGIADGHGDHGHWASHFVVQFVLCIAFKDGWLTGSTPTASSIQSVFFLTNEALTRRAETERFDISESGTTLTLCIVDLYQCRALIGWVGDSRCVHSCGASLVENLVLPHALHDRQELQRLHTAGAGMSHGEGAMRVLHPSLKTADGQLHHGLAMTRSIGDLDYKKIGVTFRPGVKSIDLGGPLDDHFILCCSDGIWDHITNEEAAGIIRSFGRSNADAAVEALVSEAKTRWLQDGSGLITDDISAIVVWLDASPKVSYVSSDPSIACSPSNIS